ncbi:MAG: FAD-dependent oxidoreductase [Candidatus Bathyarchaeia archaeon]
MESRFPKLFEPINIGRMWLKNRIAMAPMATHFAKDGIITEQLINYYVKRAKGGAALIYLEACYFDYMTGRGGPNRIHLHIDENIPKMRQLTDAIHEHNAKIVAQLNHRGRVGVLKHLSSYPVSASSVPYPLYIGTPPITLSVDQILAIQKSLVNAVRIIMETGFDGVCIHAGHGYLIAQFLSPFTNKRKDIYGGNLDNRMRFLLEIIEGIKKLNYDFPCIVRISVDEFVEGGLSLEEAKVIAQRLEEIGVNLIAVSGGARDSIEWQVQPTAIPQGCFVHFASHIKKVVKIPVSVAGRIKNPEMAEKILLEGKADIIDMGRALIADPELPRKVMYGRIDDIKPCIGCLRCFDMACNDMPIICSVNVEVGKEEVAIKPANNPKRVLIVGGGPAGLEVARVTALRGHDVTLFEKKDELGGQLRLAAVPPYKKEIGDLLKYLVRQILKLGVKIKLREEVTAGSVFNEKFDVLVIATGALPVVPRIPGVHRKNVITAWDVLEGRPKVLGEKIVIIGGGMVGCETADYLSEKGKNVTIIEMLSDVATDVGPVVRKLLLRRLAEKSVMILINSKVEKIEEGNVVIKTFDKKVNIKADTVVLAVGAKPNNELVNSLKGKVPNLLAVGDCVKPQKILEAIHDSFKVAMTI